MELIAEIGINHNGDLGIAKKLIDAAAAAGCDYVKFQKRDIETLFTPEELAQKKDSPWGTTYREYKEALEFDFDDYAAINLYCKNRVGWFASPWDIPSVGFLSRFNVPFIKIASASNNDDSLLEACRDTGIPIILSTGMSDADMIDHAVDILGRKNIYCIMQCTSTYPTKKEDVNIAGMYWLKGKYPWAKIGFSNHYPGLTAMQAAIAHGADMLEFHVTLDRAMWGSDQAASIEPEGVYKIAKYARDMPLMIGDRCKFVCEDEKPISKKLRRIPCVF